MKYTLLFCLVLAFTFSAIAQTAAPTPQLYSDQTIANMRRIQQAMLGSDYALNQVGHLANNIGPRLSGGPQAAKAVEYVAAEMRKLGLDVRLEKCMVPHWVRGEEHGELVEFEGMATGTVQKVVLAALGGSIATPADGMTGEIVVVGSFDELNALGRKGVEGKIVLFNNKFDREMQASGFGGAAYGQAVAYRFGGAMAAARLGAIAVLVRSAGGSQNRLAHTGAMGYAPNADAVRSSWRRPAVTTCCSAGRRAQARRCSHAGCRESCRRWRKSRRSRSRASIRSRVSSTRTIR